MLKRSNESSVFQGKMAAATVRIMLLCDYQSESNWVTVKVT